MLAILLMLQVAQPQPAPDIQLEINATARRVVIVKEGEADLTVRTAVNGRGGENNVVQVEAPELPEGRRELNNVTVRVRAEARVPGPPNAAPPQEPAEPQ